MTAEKPRVSLDGLYNVKQTCDALGVCKTTLRKYTDAGFIKATFRRGTQTKAYKGREIIRFWAAEC